jgi:hypothetical protein
LIIVSRLYEIGEMEGAMRPIWRYRRPARVTANSSPSIQPAPKKTRSEPWKMTPEEGQAG